MGVRQLSFDIYKVDENATKEAVEHYLLQAREYKITEYIPVQPTVTAGYSDMPRSFTGLTSDQTGDIVTKNIDEYNRRKAHIERAEKAVSRLPQRQQTLIRTRYFDSGEDVWDYEAAEEIGYSERHYRRIKTLAIYRLASMLGLLVFKE